MIKLTCLHGTKLYHPDILEISKINGEIWVDCHNPTKMEIRKLSQQIDISTDDMMRALDEDERPGITEFDNFTRLTIHAPFIKRSHHTTVPFSIFVKKRMILILRNGHIEPIDSFFNSDDDKKVEMLQKDNTYTIHQLLLVVMNSYFSILDEFEKKINKIDKDAFRSIGDKYIKDISDIKKTLIYFHKSLVGCRDVISGIEKQFIKEIKGKYTKKFRYVYNDFNQLIDMTDTYRAILDNALSIHYSAMSNDMNEIMKRLTLITSFILIPSLIAGFFGMNFKFEPPIFAGEFMGYPFVILLMLSSAVMMYIFFRKEKWL